MTKKSGCYNRANETGRRAADTTDAEKPWHLTD